MKQISIFHYDSFSTFLKNEVESKFLAKRGRKKQLSEHLRLHPTTLSQIFAETRSFTNEQVYLLGEFLGLSEVENEYLLVLYQMSQTNLQGYKKGLLRRKASLKEKSLNLSNRLEKDKILTEHESSVFYSAWYYTCLWVYLSLEGGKTLEDTCRRLKIDREKVFEVLEFLLSAGLCRIENGRYFHQTNQVHLEKSSPYLKQHHSNWRIKAIDKLDRPDQEDLHFTAPLSLSKKDFDKLREEMVLLIKNVSKTVKKTSPEEIYCFNLDLFKI